MSNASPYLNGFQTLLVQVAAFKNKANVKYKQLSKDLSKPVCCTEFCAFYPNMVIQPNGDVTQLGSDQEMVYCSIIPQNGEGRRIDEGLVYSVTGYYQTRKTAGKTETSQDAATGEIKSSEAAPQRFTTFKVISAVEVDAPEWWPTFASTTLETDFSGLEKADISDFEPLKARSESKATAVDV